MCPTTLYLCKAWTHCLLNKCNSLNIRASAKWLKCKNGSASFCLSLSYSLFRSHRHANTRVSLQNWAYETGCHANKALWLSGRGEVISFQSDSHCLCPPPPSPAVTLEPWVVPGYWDSLSLAPCCLVTTRILCDLWFECVLCMCERVYVCSYQTPGKWHLQTVGFNMHRVPHGWGATQDNPVRTRKSRQTQWRIWSSILSVCGLPVYEIALMLTSPMWCSWHSKTNDRIFLQIFCEPGEVCLLQLYELTVPISKYENILS